MFTQIYPYALTGIETRDKIYYDGRKRNKDGRENKDVRRKDGGEEGKGK